jgi:hypothetical protein
VRRREILTRDAADDVVASGLPAALDAKKDQHISVLAQIYVAAVEVCRRAGVRFRVLPCLDDSEQGRGALLHKAVVHLVYRYRSNDR